MAAFFLRPIRKASAACVCPFLGSSALVVHDSLNSKPFAIRYKPVRRQVSIGDIGQRSFEPAEGGRKRFNKNWLTGIVYRLGQIAKKSRNG
jgi:hypothetical protein